MEKKHKIIIAVAAVLAILILAIPAMMIFGVVIWQLGVFNPPTGMNRCFGFDKIRCLEHSIIYDDNSDKLRVTFTNVIGNDIKITGVKVSGDCTSGSFEEVELTTGQMTEFSCTGAKKKRGERFLVDVEITYDKKVAGTTIIKKESGRIAGTVE